MTDQALGEYYMAFAKKCQIDQMRREQNPHLPPAKPWDIYPFEHGFHVFKLKNGGICYQYAKDAEDVDQFIYDAGRDWSFMINQSIDANPILKIARQKLNIQCQQKSDSSTSVKPVAKKS